MISFEPLWKTLKSKNITTYKLIKDFNISRGTLDNLKHDRNINLSTIEMLCEILECPIEDVVKIYFKK